MGLKHTSVALVAAILSLVSRAEAGIYADELSKCLVRSASADDQLMLVRWMFSAVTLHPALQSMASITAQQRETYNKSMVDLYQRLTFNDCRKEAIDGLKYEGPAVFSLSFQVLGQVAARGMFGDPHVTAEISGLSRYFDSAKTSALYKEAGVPEPQAPPPAAPVK